MAADHGRQRVARSILIALLSLALVGCGGSATPAPASQATGSPSAGESPQANASVSPAAGSAAVVSSPTHGPYRLLLDPTLLAVLPGTLGDLKVTEWPDLETPVLGDAELSKSADRFAGAVVGDPGGPDWATVEVIELKPGSRTDAAYAVLRTQLDTGGCSQAGGVASRETIVIGTRTVDHDVCQGSVDLYLTRSSEQGLLIYVWSVGPQQLGQQLIASLRD